MSYVEQPLPDYAPVEVFLVVWKFGHVWQTSVLDQWWPSERYIWTMLGALSFALGFVGILREPFSPRSP